MRYILGLLLAIALSLLPLGSEAVNPRVTRKLVESTLLVSGKIVIAPDGTVKDYTLVDTRALGAPLEQFLDANIRRWRFQPVMLDGAAVTAEAPMRIRLVAHPQDGGGMQVRIAATWFGEKDDGRPATDFPRQDRINPPIYPREAQMLEAQGIVYLVVSIGRDGKVQQVDVERVNLRTLGTEQQMAALRRQFADASLRAARDWTFLPPTTGKEAELDHWLVRVPVDFQMVGLPQPKPGEWQSYIPDPTVRELPSWAREQLRIAGSPEALPDSGVFPLTPSRFQLLNAPGT
ncbi:MAG: hypothetical protein ACK4MZ_02590 [Thermomonas haemolytica]